MGAGGSVELAASIRGDAAAAWEDATATFLRDEEDGKQTRPLTWGCGRRGRTFELPREVLDSFELGAADVAATTAAHRSRVRDLKQAINEIYCECASVRATPPPTPPTMASTPNRPAEKQVDWSGIMSKIMTRAAGWDEAGDAELIASVKKVQEDFSKMNTWVIDSAFTQPAVRRRWRRVPTPADLDDPAGGADIEWLCEYTVVYFRAAGGGVVGSRTLHSIFDYLNAAAVARKIPAFLADFSGVEHPLCEMQYCRGYQVLAVSLPYEPVEPIFTEESLPSASFGYLLSAEHDVPASGFGWAVGETSQKVYLLPGLTEFGVHDRDDAGGEGSTATTTPPADARKKAVLKCVVGLHTMLTNSDTFVWGGESPAVPLTSGPQASDMLGASVGGFGDAPASPVVAMRSPESPAVLVDHTQQHPLPTMVTSPSPPPLPPQEGQQRAPRRGSKLGAPTLMVPPLSPVAHANGGGTSPRPSNLKSPHSLGVGLLSPLAPSLTAPRSPAPSEHGGSSIGLAPLEDASVQNVLIEMLEDQGLDHFALGLVYRISLGPEGKTAALVEMIARGLREEWVSAVYTSKDGAPAPVDDASGRQDYVARELAASGKVFDFKAKGKKEAMWKEVLVPHLKSVYEVDVGDVRVTKDVVRRAWTRALTLCGVAVAGGKAVSVSPVTRRTQAVMSPEVHRGLTPEDFEDLLRRRREQADAAAPPKPAGCIPFALPALLLAQAWLEGDVAAAADGVALSLRTIPSELLSVDHNLRAVRRLKATAASTVLAVAARQRMRGVQGLSVAQAIEDMEHAPGLPGGGASASTPSPRPGGRASRQASRGSQRTNGSAGAGGDDGDAALAPPPYEPPPGSSGFDHDGYEDVGVALTGLAEMLMAERRWQEAERHLTLSERYLAKVDSDQLRIARNNLGVCCFELGDVPRATRVYRTMIEAAKERNEPTHSTVNNLATLLYKHGTPDSWREAELLYNEALALAPTEQARAATVANWEKVKSTRVNWAVLRLQARARGILIRRRLDKLPGLPARIAVRVAPAAADGATGHTTAHAAAGRYQLLYPRSWLHGYGTWVKEDEGAGATHWYYIQVTRAADRWRLARCAAGNPEWNQYKPRFYGRDLEGVAEGAHKDVPLSPVTCGEPILAVDDGGVRVLLSTPEADVASTEEPAARDALAAEEATARADLATAAAEAATTAREADADAAAAAEQRKAHEDAAATKIQALHRGNAARKDADATRQAKADADAQEKDKREAEENAAATKIQAVQRGRAARKDADVKRQAKADADAQAAAEKEREAADAEAKRKAEEDAAATKIQSLHRGNAARKDAEAKRQAKADADADAQAAAELKAKEQADAAAKKTAEEEAAATKIQALHRGNAARKDADAKRQAKADAEKEQEAKREAEENAAATKIQAVQRGRAARKDADVKRQAKADTEAAAAAAALKKKEEEEEEEDARAREAAEAEAERKRKAQDAKEAEEAAAAAAAAEKQRAEEEAAAATKIQALHRGNAARKDADAKRQAKDKQAAEETAAATKIQALHRGNAARKDANAKRQAKAGANAAAEEQKMKDAAEEEARARKAAEAEAEAEEARKRKEAEDAKAAENAAVAKQKAEEEKAAATKIQALHRGNATRKDVDAKRQAKADADAQVAAEKEQKEREALRQAKAKTEREAAAAVQIQAVARGRAARREAAGMRGGAARDGVEAEEEEARADVIAGYDGWVAATSCAVWMVDVDEAEARAAIDEEMTRVFLIMLIDDSDIRKHIRARIAEREMAAMVEAEEQTRRGIECRREASLKRNAWAPHVALIEAAGRESVCAEARGAYSGLVTHSRQSARAAAAVATHREMAPLFERIARSEKGFRHSLQSAEALDYARLMWKAEQSHTKVMIGLVKEGREYEYFLSLLPKAEW